MIDDGHVRALLIACAIATSACTSPALVDCGSGRFVRIDDEAWCVISRGDSLGCPDYLMVEHDLPWGGRACARELHDTLPEAELCMADPRCTGDGG